MLLLSLTSIQADELQLSKIEKRGVADDQIDCKLVTCITITKYILRDPSVLTTASMSVDYIDQFTIENTNTIDTVQAIARVTGLNVVQSGPTGQQTSVFMRGMNSNHTMVAINGVAIKDHSTTGGLHDIGADFVKHVTGIQVVKGSQGTLYGANAVGGVINFITTDNYANSISATIGSNKTKGLTLKLHKSVKNHSISLIADGTTSEGISVAPTGSEKDGFNANNITLNTSSKFEGVELKTTYIRRESDSDLDSGTGDDLDYTTESDMNLYQWSGKVDTDFGFYNIVFSRTEYDRDYYNGTEHDEYNSTSDTILFTNTITNDKWDLTPGIEFEHFDGSFNNRGGYSASVDTDGENFGYFLNGNMMASDKLLVSAGIRQDDPSLFGGYTTYRLGGTFDLTSNIKLKSNYATSVKTPTLYEMHGSDNFGFNGNPNLLPEEAETIDIGFEYTMPNSILDVVYFTTDLDNLITYGSATYNNASGTSNRHGVEMQFNSLLTENVNWRNSATFTVAEDSNGTRVTRRPKWMGLSAIDWRHNDWTGTVEYLHTGSHLDIDSSTYATITKPAVGVINLHGNMEISGKSNLILSVNNAFDKTYDRPDGYAQHGRNLLLTYKLKF